MFSHKTQAILVKHGGLFIGLLLIGAFLLSSGQIARAREEPAETPHFAADIQSNGIHSWGWQPNTVLTWQIDGPDADPGWDYSLSAPTDASGYALGWVGWDIQPGDLIETSDGTTTRTLLVEPLAVTNLDAEGDIVGGTAYPGAPVTVAAWGSSPVTASVDGAGNWEADLTGSHDVGLCSSGPAEILDADGDATWYIWSMRCPKITADPQTNNIWGEGYLPATPLTIEVDDAGNGAGVDYTLYATSDGNGIFGGVDTTPSYDLKIGDTVIVSGGGDSKSLLLANLAVTSIDLAADTVTGTGTPGQVVAVTINGTPYMRTPTVDGSGDWVADFSTSIDLQDGAGGWLYEHDADGDTTNVWWQDYHPVFSAHPDDNWIEGWGWPIYSTVHIEIDSPDTGPGVDYQVDIPVGRVQGANDPNYFNTGEVPFNHDIEAGDQMTASAEGYVKSLTVTDLVTLGTDAGANTIFGTGTPGGSVAVDVHNQPQETRVWATVQGDNRWTGNYDDIGFDLLPGQWGRALQFDGDGDSTADDWRVPRPVFQAAKQYDRLEGWDWPPNTTLDILIEESGNTQTDTVNTDGNGYFYYDHRIEIHAGQTITISGGGASKTLEVIWMEVQAAEAQSNRVTGVCDRPGIEIVVEVFDRPTYTTVTTNCAQGSYWEADFDSIGDDLNPGDHGRAHIYDDDGDASVDDWRIYNPEIVIRPESDELWGNNYPPNSLMAVLIEQHDTGWGAEYAGSAVTDGNGNFYLNTANEFDMQTGDFVMVTDGEYTKSHTITPLQVTAIDLPANTISGVAAPHGSLYIGTHGDPGQAMSVEADQDGNWTADFTAIGHSLARGESGWVEEFDREGDRTHDIWRIFNPNVSAHPDDDWLEGWDWPNGATVYVTIDGGNPQNSYSGSAVVGACSYNGDPTYFCLNDIGFDIQAGQVVTASDGQHTKTLAVTSLVVTEVAEDTNEVRGTADPGAVLVVSLHNKPEYIGMQVTADGNGEWVADFSLLSPSYTLQPGDNGRAQQADDDGDLTADDWRVLAPRFEVHADEDWLEGWDWPYQVPVTIDIDDPGTPQNPDWSIQTAGGTCPWSNDPNQFCEQNLGIDLQAGFTLTADDGSHHKVLVISDLVVDGVDEGENTVWGRGTPNQPIQVWVHGQGNTLNPTISSGGNWQVDFDDIDYDLKPGDMGRAAEYDLDNDGTADDWRTPDPRLEASALEDRVEAWEWPEGATVTLLVGDPNQPDYTASQTVAPAPWNPSETYAYFNLKGQFNLQPGMLLTMTGAGIQKELILTSLQIMAVDYEENTVAGVTDSGLLVHLWICDNNGCADRWADPSGGAWMVDFDLLGHPYDQGSRDLVPSDNISAGQPDAENDTTRDDWQLPGFSVHADDDWIEGWSWPDDQMIAIEVLRGGSVVYSGSVRAGDADPNNSNYFYLNLWQIFDLQPGDHVTAGSGGILKETDVTVLVVNEVNDGENTVSGTAAVGSQVLVEVFDRPEYTYQEASADIHGDWTVDFDGWPEALKPGDNGRAYQFDQDGDSTADDWYIPNPFIVARVQDDRVRCWQWPDGAWIHLTVEDPQTPASPDYEGDAQVQDSDTGLLARFNLEGLLDLHGGQLITASDGTTTRMHWVTNLTLEDVDPGTNIIAGTAEPGSRVEVQACTGDTCLDRVAFTNAQGNWQENFGQPGTDPEDPAGTMDLGPGSNGSASQYDGQGNTTRLFWSIPNPNFVVNQYYENIWGAEFAGDSEITISIDQANTGWGAEYSTTAQSDGEGNFSVDLGGTFDIQAGDTVYVSDGHDTKSHTVTRLQVQGTDADNNTVWGIAQPDGELVACLDTPERPCVNATADENGNWTADFTGTATLHPGDSGGVEEKDPEGDRTHDDWWIPNPYLAARPLDDIVTANDWPFDAALTLKIDDPVTLQNPDYEAHGTIQPCMARIMRTCLDFSFGNVFDLQPGFVVSMDDGTTTKTHIVTGLTISELDLDADLVTGTASPNASLWVNGCIGKHHDPFADCSFRNVTADGSGLWAADFSQPQDDQPPFDLQGWVTATAEEHEADDWDVTAVHAENLDTSIVVHPIDDWIQAFGWPKGTSLTLSIDAAANGTGAADFTGNYTSDDYFLDITNIGFNLMPGDIVTLEGNGLAEQHIISSLALLDVDQQADSVSGKADVGDEVWVEICDEQGCSRRGATADSNHDWSVSFAIPGPNPEDYPVDINEGTTMEAFWVDAAGNATRISWDAGVVYSCWAGNSISGHVYTADGSTPDAGAYVVFEDFNQGYQRLFQTQTDLNGMFGCQLPEGEYRVYAEDLSKNTSREYYPNAIFENASKITVGGSPVGGIDFVLDIPGYFMELLVFNWTNDLMKEPALRQAIAFGTDRQAILAATYPASPMLDSLLPPDHWAYTEDGLMQYLYDPDLAIKLLEQAGWHDQDGDGIRDRDDHKLSLEYVCGATSLRRKVAGMFADQMRQIGIEINVFSDASWRQRMRDDTFQIAQLGWIDSMTLDNPQEMFGLWNTDYSQRFSNYNNPTVEQMANLASLFYTRAEKLEYVEQFQRVAMADLPILPLFLRIEVPDRDGDGVPDAQDACPDQSNGGYDADNDGCLDTTTALKALINNLRASGQISKTATATTLLKYVTSAEAKLAVKNYTGAIAYLNAFISYVQKNSKTGGSITPAAAQKLIAYAQSLIRWIQELDNLRLGALLEYSNNEEFPQLVTAEDQGLRLAIEQANAAGGVLGQLVLLNQRDSGYQDDTMAQNAAGDLATNLKVSAVIGPVTSRTTQAVLASVIVPAGVAEISPSSTGPAIADIPDNGLLFRLADSDAIRGAAAAQQACLDGKHKAAIIVQGGDVGGAIDLAFRNAFQAPGCGGVVQRTVEFNGDPGDTLRQALGNDPLDMPDLIFVGIYFDDNLVYELAQAAPCVLGPDGSRASQRSWSFAGKLPDDFSQHVLENLACGAVVDAGEFAGWASLAPAYEHDYGPASFATAYQAAYGMAPEPFANLAYDAAALVMLAAEEAHSNSPALIKAHLPTVASGGTPVYDLVQALALVRAGTNIDWQGSYALQVGGISFAFNHAFDANGETSGVYLVFRLQSDGLLTLEGTVTP